MKRSIRAMATIALSFCVAAGAGTAVMAEESSNTIYVGQSYVAKSADPTDSNVPWNLTSHGISESIYMLDENGELYSRIVDSMEQTGELDWNITMKQDVKFSDGSVVDAAAICDGMNEVIEKNGFSNATAGKLTFEATGEYTFTVHTERETKDMASVLAEWQNITFKNLGDGNYVFTGPYMIDSLDPGVEVSLKPNPYYDEDADQRPDVVVKKFEDTSAMQLAFESGEIDMAFTVTPDVADILEGEGYTVKNIDAGYQYFCVAGLQREAMSDLNVRRALDLIFNREEMLTALKGGRLATGFFATYYSFAGTTELKTDVDAASEYLTEAGYTKNDSGIWEKDGQELELKLATYASRPDLVTIMQLAASQLNAAGINTTTEIVDSISTAASSGEYDLCFWAQHTAPTGDPAYSLNQFFREGAAYNCNGYQSEKMETVLDELNALTPGEERNAKAVEAQAIIYEDLPVFYLVDPQWHIAVSDELTDYQPYCGDYYVINAKLGLE